MRLYVVKDPDDDAMFVLAECYMDAIHKWQKHMDTEEEPNSVALIAENAQLLT